MAARWRLTGRHYLNIPGTSWEYKELNRATGKQERLVLPVPTYLNPTEPSDWNYKHNQDEGEIIVANAADSAFPRDIIFAGSPTPDMFPLNDEAKAISAQYADMWKHPIDSLPGTFSQSLLTDLQNQVADVRSKVVGGPAPAHTEGMTELLAAMAAMMKQNQEMMAMVLKPAPAELRR